jgi:hypothetical protein
MADTAALALADNHQNGWTASLDSVERQHIEEHPSRLFALRR